MVRMASRESSFKQGARVRLRAAVDPAIYGDFAVYGNEGVIKDVRLDRWGLPEVFIHWDKNHWTYNGVGDCWTFPDHFEIVKDSMADKKEQQKAALAALAQLFGLDDEPESQESPQAQRGSKLRDLFANAVAKETDPDPGEDEDFTHAVEAASLKMAESEAFVIIGVDRRDHPRAPEGMLEPYALSYSKTPEGEILLTAHMAQLSARAHQDLAIRVIHHLLSNDA